MAKKKREKKENSSYIVIDRRCDRPMAEKKNFLPCEGGSKCKTCVACLVQLLNGEWEHCDPLRGVANRSSIAPVTW